MQSSVSSTSPLYLTRFIAACMVLAYHSAPVWYKATYADITKWGEAVNYFFFISGFVMLLSCQRYLQNNANLKQFSKVDFWIKRIARIYPVYVLALLIMVCYHYFVAFSIPSIPSRFPMEVLGLQRWVYAGSINSPGWSVSCEFLFYFLFPFTLAWLWYTPLKKLVLQVTGLFLLNVAVALFMNQYLMPLQSGKLVHMLISTVYGHPLFKYTIFLAGNVCGIIYIRYLQARSFNQYLVAAVLLASLASILYFLHHIPGDSPLIASGMLTPLYFIFVVSLCKLEGLLLRLLSARPFIFLGEISYGVYIFQLPVWFFVTHFTGVPILHHAFAHISGFTGYACILILFATVVYYLYEMPAKNAILKWYTQSRERRQEKLAPGIS
ncbi:acyltransferase family protein [Deminuibacter soli]|uniref:Acyltransferase n=1 Tax=Deminuibacter soli TaxID=2291815 RepID=A0A3E1NHG1_9BACT|nr:acyltransferase [Deminuibacter soli]RFM27389.1 acyltransferase [Deminuibacter soli]